MVCKLLLRRILPGSGQAGDAAFFPENLLKFFRNLFVAYKRNKFWGIWERHFERWIMGGGQKVRVGWVGRKNRSKETWQ